MRGIFKIRTDSKKDGLMSEFRVVAKDADDAIRIAKNKFEFPGERLESCIFENWIRN